MTRFMPMDPEIYLIFLLRSGPINRLVQHIGTEQHRLIKLSPVHQDSIARENPFN